MFNIFLQAIPYVGIALLIEKCLGSNMLLGKYGDWIRNIDKELEDIICWSNVPKYKRLSKLSWLLKPLGGCIYCYNVWITSILYSIISFIKLSYISEIELLLIIGITHLYLIVIKTFISTYKP